MNKLIKCVVISALFLSSLHSYAESKMSVVSLEAAILQTELAKEVLKREEENAVFKDKAAQLENLSKELKELAENYKRDEAVLSPEQKAAQQQLLKSKESEAVNIQKQLVNAQQQLRMTLVRRNQQAAFQAAQQVAGEEDVDIMLNASAVLYMKDLNDLTAKVTDKLNKLSEKK